MMIGNDKIDNYHQNNVRRILNEYSDIGSGDMGLLIADLLCRMDVAVNLLTITATPGMEFKTILQVAKIIELFLKMEVDHMIATMGTPVWTDLQQRLEDTQPVPDHIKAAVNDLLRKL